MSTEEEIVLACLDRPDDESLRMILADCLAENGEDQFTLLLMRSPGEWKIGSVKAKKVVWMVSAEELPEKKSRVHASANSHEVDYHIEFKVSRMPKCHACPHKNGVRIKGGKWECERCGMDEWDRLQEAARKSRPRGLMGSMAYVPPQGMYLTMAPVPYDHWSWQESTLAPIRFTGEGALQTIHRGDQIMIETPFSVLVGQYLAYTPGIGLRPVATVAEANAMALETRSAGERVRIRHL